MICAPWIMSLSGSPASLPSCKRLLRAALGLREVAPQQCHARSDAHCAVPAHRRFAEPLGDHNHPLSHVLSTLELTGFDHHHPLRRRSPEFECGVAGRLNRRHQLFQVCDAPLQPVRRLEDPEPAGQYAGRGSGRADLACECQRLLGELSAVTVVVLVEQLDRLQRQQPGAPVGIVVELERPLDRRHPLLIDLTGKRSSAPRLLASAARAARSPSSSSEAIREASSSVSPVGGVAGQALRLAESDQRSQRVARSSRPPSSSSARPNSCKASVGREAVQRALAGHRRVGHGLVEIDGGGRLGPVRARARQP